MAAKVFGRQALFPLKKIIPELEQWFLSSIGQSILHSQHLALQDLLKTLYGKQILQLSMLRDIAFATEDCKVPLCMGPLAV